MVTTFVVVREFFAFIIMSVSIHFELYMGLFFGVGFTCIVLIIVLIIF